MPTRTGGNFIDFNAYKILAQKIINKDFKHVQTHF